MSKGGIPLRSKDATDGLNFADVAKQDVDSLFAVDFLVAAHRDHDGGMKSRVGEGNGDNGS